MGVVTREWGEVVFAASAESGSGSILLDAAEQHHLSRVLRVRAGAAVVAVNGRGIAFFCIVEADGSLTVRSEAVNWGESMPAIHVCCAVLKGDGMREVTDGATALGAASIRFFKADRSEGQFNEDKRERLLRVAIAAMKQCGRSRLPDITYAASLAEASKRYGPHVLCVAAHPLSAGATLESKPDCETRAECALFVGPEGGLSENEVEGLLKTGGTLMDLGQRRLRAELAVLAGIEKLRSKS